MINAVLLAAFALVGAECTMTLEEFRDRMKGGWLGQSIGVAYGAPTEFKYKGTTVPEEKMPVWSPDRINNTFEQDDLYVEMTFIDTLLRRGVDVSVREAGIDFANSTYRLWCANSAARNNLRSGIAAPASSHPRFHPTTDDIDYQIEADFSGILAPGLPQAAVDFGETFGRIMNYGDGLYAGQFIGAMYAEAYFETSRVEVVKKALRTIPARSQYAEMVRDVQTWYGTDASDWRGAWRKAVDKYAASNRLGRVSSPALSAKLNGAMVLMGFLFGEGDMDRTMRISTACGYDSDCNPSSACGVLGVMLGEKGIDERFRSGLDRTKKWEYTDYNWDALVAASETLVRKIVVKYGGRIVSDRDGRERIFVPVVPVRPSAFADSSAPGSVPPNERLSAEECERVLYLPCGEGNWSKRRQTPQSVERDIVIYGSSPAAISAAVQACRMGKSVVIVSPETRIGGLTTGGLGETDIGNKSAYGGIALEFYRDVAKWYGCEGSMWKFEPSAALAILEGWEKRDGLDIRRDEWLDRESKSGVEVEGGRIRSIRTLNGNVYRGKMFVDATYEGDLMAAAGVSYAVGRESNRTYGEQNNGNAPNAVGAANHNLEPGVSSYIKEGDRSSGLLPGVEPYDPNAKPGDGDKRVQAYCFRMCLTANPTNCIPFGKPENYDERQYELLFRNLAAQERNHPEWADKRDGWHGFNWINSPMPNGKTDTNNRLGFSTDFIGGSWNWAEASYAERAKIFQAHLDYQRGLMWTLANHPRVPERMRYVFSRWGTCKDEFLDGPGDGWQSQLYVREARRMIGETVMIEWHCRGADKVAHPVALGSYTLDSHHCRRVETADGFVVNEGNVENPFMLDGRTRFKPYGIDYGAIVPKRAECSNLFVPVCLSASHIAFGSIRMEPVFFALGQAAGTAAALSIDAGCAVQDLPYGLLATRLLSDGQVISDKVVKGSVACALVPRPRDVRILPGVIVDPVVIEKREAALPAEGYRLTVDEKGATLVAASDVGLFYARKTLDQLSAKVGDSKAYPFVEISDSPVYAWRGVHFDDCRHFFGLNAVKRVLDQMAEHKLNRFHWHLTDDQGWRLEIPGYPDLVTYGAVRSASPRRGIRPRGTGEATYYLEDMDGVRYGPFYYTEKDVREVLAYAAARHITVVPEIELPGHAFAAIAAYPELTCFPENAKARDPRLTWGVSHDVICLGNDKAIKFYEDVLDYVCRLFPGEYVHIGGDECPSGRWAKCPKCQTRMKAEGLKDVRELQPWATRHFVRFLEARGKRAVGWDEYIDEATPASAIGMNWHVRPPVPGHDMIMAPEPNAYLDYAQGIEDDPFQYYGRHTLSDCYNLDPRKGVAASERHHILGGQCCNWSEYTWNETELDWKMWPRACATAEALWLGETKPGYEDFVTRLRHHRRRLVSLGINCAPIPD